MFPLIETIRVQDGQFNNLSYHQQRFALALREIFDVREDRFLEKELAAVSVPTSGIYKCRVLYNAHASQIEFAPYTARPLQSLKLVTDDLIVYDHKFSDRTALEKCFQQRGVCDDVLVVKNGRVTDTSYANIALKRGKEWFTPAHGLLRGTMRESLLERKLIREVEIAVREIPSFEAFRLINAMLLFDAPEVSTKNIVN